MPFPHRVAFLFIFAAATVQATPADMFGTYFLDDETCSSALVLHNKRIDASVTVTPVLFVSGGQVDLPSLTLAPKQTESVALKHGEATAGGVGVRYSFPEPG